MRAVTRWDIARELRFLPRLPLAIALAFWFLGRLIVRFGGERVGGVTATLALLSVSAILAWWAYDRLLKEPSSGEIVTRGKEHANANEGCASGWDLLQYTSAGAMRRQAGVIAPSLKSLSWWALRRVSADRYSVLLARAGWTLWLFNFRAEVRCAIEDVVMRVGGPRRGKSQSLACHILDAAGLVVVTSTKAELLTETGPDRAKVGRVHVFNPTGLGDIESTVRWSPLVGCEDFETAQRRATSMIQDRGGEAKVWSDQARRVLAVLLHAAARMPGGRMQQVSDWVSDLSEDAGRQITRALHGAPNVLALVADLRQVVGTNDRTKTSTTTTITQALQWLASARSVQVGDADPGAPDFFDVRAFVRAGRDSLYLIGSPESTAVAPLISALTAEVAYWLRMHASLQPGERLDPHATLILDEMDRACPQVPIDNWTADMGGRGVHIQMSVQSLAQLRGTWGDNAADAILNNVGHLLIFGGTKSDADLRTLAALMGQRLEQLDPDDKRYQQVLDPANLSALAVGHVVVLPKGLRPVVGRAPQIWQRRIVSRWARLTARVRPGRQDVAPVAPLVLGVVIDDEGSAAA
jgi:type IV secretion system protein VirD4